jgi:hypothetical protein
MMKAEEGYRGSGNSSDSLTIQMELICEVRGVTVFDEAKELSSAYF